MTLEEKVKRLESENKVLRQIISETIKALQNVENFTSMTTLETITYVANPYKNERTDPFRSPFGDH
jgi:hypothetical protein